MRDGDPPLAHQPIVWAAGCRQAQVRCRGNAVRRPRVSSAKLSSRPPSNWSSPSSAACAAASSIASGMPSKRRQMVEMEASSASPIRNRASAARARTMNGRTDPLRRTSAVSPSRYPDGDASPGRYGSKSRIARNCEMVAVLLRSFISRHYSGEILEEYHHLLLPWLAPEQGDQVGCGR